MSLQCFVDIETTGFSPKTEKITRIAVIKVKGRDVIDLYDKLVNPGKLVDPKLLVMTGLDQRILNFSPSLDAIRPSFIEFTKSSMMFGWGNFENKWIPLHGLGAKVFDLIPFVKEVLGTRVENYKLHTVAKYFGLPLRHHDALSDALTAFRICFTLGIL